MNAQTEEFLRLLRRDMAKPKKPQPTISLEALEWMLTYGPGNERWERSHADDVNHPDYHRRNQDVE